MMRLLICSVFFTMTLPQHFGINTRDDSRDENSLEKFTLMGEDENKDNVIVVTNLNDFIAREEESSHQQPTTRDYDEFMPFSFDSAIRKLQSGKGSFKSEQPENVSACRIIRPIVLISSNTNESLRKNKYPGATINNCHPTNSDGCRYLARSSIQQPLYAEEPGWVEIDPEYGDSLLGIVQDPYFVSRGKKIFRLLNGESNEKLDENTDVRIGSSKNNRAVLNERGEKTDNLKRARESNEGNSSQYLDALMDNFRDNEDPFFVTRGKKMIVRIKPKFGEEIKKNAYKVRRKRSLDRKMNRLKGENVKMKMPLVMEKFKGLSLKKEDTRSSINSERKNVESNKMPAGGYTELSKILNGFQSGRPVSRKRRSACTNSSCKEKTMTSSHETQDKMRNEWIKNIEIKNRDNKGINDARLFDQFIISRNKKSGLDGKYYGVRNENQSNHDNKRHPTSRKNFLDELLANYDPYYVTRGKRMQVKFDWNT